LGILGLVHRMDMFFGADGRVVGCARTAHRSTCRRSASPRLREGASATTGRGRYHLEPEQGVALTDPTIRACVIGGLEAFTSASPIAPALLDVFRDGSGWGGRG
jgi:hypothetical protein